MCLNVVQRIKNMGGVCTFAAQKLISKAIKTPVQCESEVAMITHCLIEISTTFMPQNLSKKVITLWHPVGHGIILQNIIRKKKHVR